MGKKRHKKKGMVPDSEPNATLAKKNSDLSHNKRPKNICQVTYFNYNQNSHYTKNCTKPKN